jgi:hypothetical protein
MKTTLLSPKDLKSLLTKIRRFREGMTIEQKIAYGGKVNDFMYDYWQKEILGFFVYTCNHTEGTREEGVEVVISTIAEFPSADIPAWNIHTIFRLNGEVLFSSIK